MTRLIYNYFNIRILFFLLGNPSRIVIASLELIYLLKSIRKIIHQHWHIMQPLSACTYILIIVYKHYWQSSCSYWHIKGRLLLSILDISSVKDVHLTPLLGLCKYTVTLPPPMHSFINYLLDNKKNQSLHLLGRMEKRKNTNVGYS